MTKIGEDITMMTATQVYDKKVNKYVVTITDFAHESLGLDIGRRVYGELILDGNANKLNKEGGIFIRFYIEKISRYYHEKREPLVKVEDEWKLEFDVRHFPELTGIKKKIPSYIYVVNSNSKYQFLLSIKVFTKELSRWTIKKKA